MEIHITKTLSQTQFDQIIKLWNAEYPIKLQNRFELLLIDVQNYNHYLIEENNQILAWAVAFDKENETRFSIIVKDEHKGKELGTLLIEKLKFELGEFYGWVIDHDNDLKANWIFRRDDAKGFGQTVPLKRSYNYIKKILLFPFHYSFSERFSF